MLPHSFASRFLPDDHRVSTRGAVGSAALASASPTPARAFSATPSFGASVPSLAGASPTSFAWRGLIVDAKAARTLDSAAELVQLARDDPDDFPSVRFGVWQGPERPVDRACRLQRQRDIFLLSPVAASAHGLTVRHAAESGVTADDLFDREHWLHTLTPALAQTLGISWRSLTDIGLDKRHVLHASLPIEFWQQVLRADADFERRFQLRVPSRKPPKL